MSLAIFSSKFSFAHIVDEKIMQKIETDVMTIRELALYLKMAEKTLYRLSSEGKLPAFKVGAAWRFRKSEIDRWIIKQEQQKEGEE